MEFSICTEYLVWAGLRTTLQVKLNTVFQHMGYMKEFLNINLQIVNYTQIHSSRNSLLKTVLVKLILLNLDLSMNRRFLENSINYKISSELIYKLINVNFYCCSYDFTGIILETLFGEHPRLGHPNHMLFSPSALLVSHP